MAATPDASEVKSKDSDASGVKSSQRTQIILAGRLPQPAPVPIDLPKHTVSSRRPLSEPASSRSKKASKPSQPSQQRQHSTREGLPLSTIVSISAKQGASDPDDD